MKKKKSAKKILLILAMLLLLAIFLFAGFRLWSYYREGKENEELYSALAAERAEKLTDTRPSPAEQYGSFEERNSDFAGWLWIENTVIDYPVMQGKTADYYLYRNFEKKYSAFGSLYLEKDCLPDESQNLLIHGHHMKNGAMFAALTKYTDKKFYESHKIIHFDTLESYGTYEIVAAFKVDLASEKHFPYYQFIDGSEEEFNAFVKNCKARAFYNTGVDARFGDRLLTLSTCEYTQKDGRMVILAKRISE